MILDDLKGAVIEAWESRARFTTVLEAVNAVRSGGYAWQRRTGEWATALEYRPHSAEASSFLRVRRDGTVECHTYTFGGRETLRLKFGQFEGARLRLAPAHPKGLL